MRFVLACLMVLMSCKAALAHEVQAAVADFVTADGQIRIELRLGAEPIIAGVNLEGVEDTNATDRAADVDALRALSPAELETKLRESLPRISDGLAVTVGETVIPLTASAITVPPVGNVELPRESQIMLEGALPAGTDAITVSWPAEFGTLILRQMEADEPYTGYLVGTTSEPIAIAGGNAKGALGTFASYIPVGFDHIIPKGLDHILFVLGLFFLSTRMGPLLWQVSAFTLAHTVTLALGALGWVNIPGSIVEPIIAASIVYVAVENILSDGLHRWRPLVIFVFGLLHGLGFASVLGEFGLPQGQFVSALIGFNVGVELGQLAVIAMAFAVVFLAQRVASGRIDLRVPQLVYGVLALVFVAAGYLLNGPGFTEQMGAGAPVFLWPVAALSVLCLLSVRFSENEAGYRRIVAIPASVAIACVGAFWFVERVFL